MMHSEPVISQYCLIENNEVILNESSVFTAPGMGMEEFLLAMYRNSGIQYPKFYKMDHLCKLGFLATEAMWADTTAISGYQKDEIAIVLYNTNASLDADRRYYESVSELASPALFLYTLPNILIGELCIRHGITGENIFFIEERFNAAAMESYVRNILELEMAKACLCGWVDCLKDTYKACLFFVETNKVGRPFDAATMNNIYQSAYGKVNA